MKIEKPYQAKVNGDRGGSETDREGLDKGSRRSKTGNDFLGFAQWKTGLVPKIPNTVLFLGMPWQNRQL